MCQNPKNESDEAPQKTQLDCTIDPMVYRNFGKKVSRCSELREMYSIREMSLIHSKSDIKTRVTL